MSIGDDDSTCHADDTQRTGTTSQCQRQHADDIVLSKACWSHAVADDVVAESDDVDRGPRDADMMEGGAFPVRPPAQTVAASCPTSPLSDVVRTSAEGRTCDGDEQNESDDNVTSSP